MRIVLAMVVVLALANAGWAADTDVENPALRDLPLQRGGPIYGGKQHQPTPSEVSERLQEQRGGGTESAPAPATPAQRDDLYQRILQQSQQGMPHALEPER